MSDAASGFNVDRALREDFFKLEDINTQEAVDTTPYTGETMAESASLAGYQRKPGDIFVLPSTLEAKKAQNEAVQKLIASSDDPQAAMEEWEAAKYLGSYLGVDPANLYGMTAEISQKIFPRLHGAKSLPKAIADTFMAQVRSNDMSRRAFQYSMEHLFNAPTAEEDKKFFDSILPLQMEIENLNMDNVPREIVGEAMKWLAGAAPYIIEVGVSAAISGGIGGAISGGAKSMGMSAGKAVLLKTFIAKSGQVATTLPLLQGADYVNLRMRGAEHSTALGVSVATGLINTALETMLGTEAGVSELFSKGASASLTTSIVQKLHLSNKLVEMGQIFGTRSAIDLLSNVAEEGMEAFVTDIGVVIADAIMTQNGQAIIGDKMTISAMAKDVAQQALIGGLVSAAYGIPTNFALAVRDTKAMEKIKKAAPALGLDQTITAVKQSGAVVGDDSVQAAVGKAIYEKALNDENIKAINLKDVYIRAKTEGQSKITRLESGDLYMTESSTTDLPEGGQEVTVDFGSPETGEHYASVDLVVTNNEVIISDAEVQDQYVGILEEAIRDISDKYYDREIGISSTADSMVKMAYDAIVEENGGKAQVNKTAFIKDAAKMQEVRRLRSELQMAGVENIKELNFAQHLISMLSTKELRALKIQGADTLGFTPEGQGIAGKITFNDVKKTLDATIYLAKNQTNPVTVAHELGHFYRRAKMGTTEMRSIESAYGIQDGKWESVHEERFTNELLSYLQDGKAPAPELTTFFQRAAQWIKTLWNQAMRVIDINPNVRAAFDKWLSTEEAEPEPELDVGGVELVPEEYTEPLFRDGIAVGTPDAGAVAHFITPERAAEVMPIAESVAKKTISEADFVAKSITEEQNPSRKAELAALESRLRYRAGRFFDGSWMDDGLLVADVLSEVEKVAYNEIVNVQGPPVEVVVEEELEEVLAPIVHNDTLVQFNGDELVAEEVNDQDVVFETISQGDLAKTKAWSKAPVVDVLVSSVVLCNDVPQFKHNADKKGLVVPILADEYITDPVRPVLIWRRLNGSLELFTGRHRFDLAQRLNVENIPAQIYNESDGFTAINASIMDIESNLMDNQGEVIDYVRYFRATGLSEEAANARGLLRTAQSRIAFRIGKYAIDPLYALYLNRGINEAKADAIIRAAGNNTGAQATGIDHHHEMTADELYAFVASSARFMGQYEQGDLFGDDTSFDRDMAENRAMAKEGVKRLKELEKTRAALKHGKALGSESVAKVVEKFGHKAGDMVATQAEVERLDREIERMNEWWMYPDLVKSMRADLELGYNPLFDSVEETAEATTEQDDGTPELFMLKEELSPLAIAKGAITDKIVNKSIRNIIDDADQSSSLNMTIDELKSRQKEMYAEHADESREYGTVDEWAESIGGDLSPEDLAYLEARFQEGHHIKEKLQYPGRGDFIKTMVKEGGIESFVKEIGDAVYLEGDRQTRVILERSPKVREVIDANRDGIKTQEARQKAIDAVAENEGLAMLILGLARKDQGLSREGRARIKALPEIKRPVNKGLGATVPGLNITDRSNILAAITDKGIRESAKDKSLTIRSLEDRIKAIKLNADEEAKLQKEEYQDFRTSARGEARLGSKAVRAEYRQKAAMKKMRDHMKKLKAYIMSSAPQSSGLQTIRAIELAQKLITRGDKTVGDVMKELRSVIYKWFPDIADSVVSSLGELSNKPFEDWSLDDLESVASLFKEWVKIGRARERFVKMAEGQYIKDVRAEGMKDIIESRHYKEPLEVGPLAKKKLNAKGELNRAFKYDWLDAMRPDVFVKRYMVNKNNKKQIGAMYQLLIRDAHKALSDKYDAIDRRKKAVMDHYEKYNMKKSMRDEIVIEGLGESTQVGAPPKPFRITRSQLIGMRLALGTKDNFNQLQREAWIYGNCFSDTEKNADGSLTPLVPPVAYDEYGVAIDLEEMKARGEMPGIVYDENGNALDVSEYFERSDPILAGGNNEYMKGLYEQKLKVALEALDKYMRPEDEGLAVLMIGAMNNSEDWNRFAKSIFVVTGKEPVMEKYYFPVVVEMQGTMKETNDISDKLKDLGMDEQVALELGIAIERKRNIAPRNRHRTKFDAWQVFFDVLDKQEHLINFGPYARQVKSVLFNSTFSGNIIEQLRNAAGDDGVKYLKSYTDLLMNPSAGSSVVPGASKLNFLRGSQVVANLSWRWSSVAMQLMTSPLPFMAEAPGELAAVTAEAWASMKWADWYKAIEEKSPILRNRQMSQEYAWLMGLEETGVSGAFKKFGQIGMKGLVFADRFSVAVGWEAVRRKTVKKLMAAETGEISQERLADIEEEARAYADEVVIRTQPSSENMFRSPIYRNMNTFMQLVFQFTQPLNVIWNNVRYDMPQALREREFGKFMGYMMGYILSGIAVGAIRAARGRGPDEDDDDRVKVGYWTHALGSQFFESVPIAGELLSMLIRSMLTGERMTVYADSNIPALQTSLEAVAVLSDAMDGSVSEESVKKNLGKLLGGMGQVAGLPTRAAEEYYRILFGGNE